MVRGEGLAREPVTMEALAERVRPVTLARDRQLPVLPELESLLPGGALRRGTTVAVDDGSGATGATTLALALAAGASQAGSWVAIVGLDSLGLVAAADLGLALDRLALVPTLGGGSGPPGGSGRGGGSGRDGGTVGWASVMAALVDGFDLVLVAAGPGVRRRPADARRLVARVRERGAVLVAVGGELPGQRSTVRLTVTAAVWKGLAKEGAGHLSGRRVTVAASGRGEAARPRRAELWLPDDGGRIAAIEPSVDPIPLRDHQPSHRAGPSPRSEASGGTVSLRPVRGRRRTRTGHPTSPREDRTVEVSGGAAS